MTATTENALEDRRIITPYAFTISPELLGLKLARPWRRALAMLLDLAVIAFLSTLNAYLMVMIACWILWRMVADEKFSRHARIGLRTLAASVMALTLTIGIFDQYLDDNPEVMEQVDEAKSVLELTLSVAKAVRCDEMDCWEARIPDVATFIAMQTTDPSEAEEAIRELLAKSELTPNQRSELAPRLAQAWLDKLGENGLKPTANQATDSQQQGATASETGEDTEGEINVVLFEGDEGNGPFSWLVGLIEELGLGFGWAACYFTLFTAWWHGQTPGKKLFRIRVLQLDNTRMSLWDAFGRYGGYAAGITTGLMGFLQIYWDPNRQAIHDKISATVVVYGDEERSPDQQNNR